MPRSSSRTTLSEALLVCSVDSTRWPVRDASIAILAVSGSRISPIMMMSGSARRNPRMAAAKVTPILGFTCTWRRPGCVISIGSSAVQILRSPVLTSANMECSVVVLPEPVGPAARIRPNEWPDRRLNVSSSRGCRPSLTSGMGLVVASRRNTTSSSPSWVGMTATRSSSLGPPNSAKLILPSCGRRRSAISSRDMILMRDTSGARNLAGRRR